MNLLLNPLNFFSNEKPGINNYNIATLLFLEFFDWRVASMFVFIILLDNEAQILFILKVNSSSCALIVPRTAEALITYLKF